MASTFLNLVSLGGNFGASDLTTTGVVTVGALVVGSTPAAAGSVRVESAVTGLAFRNNANNADIAGVAKDSSDIVYLGVSAAGTLRAASVVVDGTTSVFKSAGTTLLTGTSGVLRVASGVPVQLAGASNWATVGDLRAINATTIIAARNAAASANIAVLATNSSNSAVLGDAANGVGFFGGTGTTKQTVTGSRGANAALASLLTALASYGLVVDNST